MIHSIEVLKSLLHGIEPIPEYSYIIWYS